MPLIVLIAYLVQFNNSVVSQKYVNPSIERVKKHHIHNVAGSDICNLLLLMFDSEYRKRFFDTAFFKLLYNNRYVSFLDELRHTYGLKIEDLHDLAFEQMGFYDNEDIA